MNTSKLSWEEFVFQALVRLGGEASLQAIYEEVSKVREEAGAPLNNTWHATTRRTLQDSMRTAPGAARGTWKLVV